MVNDELFLRVATMLVAAKKFAVGLGPKTDGRGFVVVSTFSVSNHFEPTN